MRENQVFFLDKLRSEFRKILPLLLKSLTALRGSSINTEIDGTVLVSVGERMKSSVLLTLIVLVVKVVTTVSPPALGAVELWHLIVKETLSEAAAPLLESQPLQNVWFLSLTGKLGWGPLGLHVSHSIVPCGTGVGIHLPAVALLSSGPVWDLETLEHGAWLSVETDVTNTLEKGLWMEVLSVDVMHDIWLLVEFIAVDILNTHADFSCFLSVELVCHSKDVWVSELHCR